jgi:large subunit ribosomal protein L10
MKSVSQKKDIVVALTKEFSGASTIYLVNFEKVTVNKDNALRKKLRSKGVKYRAVKNTLLKRVFAELGYKGLDDAMVGATGVLIAPPDDPMLPAREIVEFQKDAADLMSGKKILFEGDVMAGSELAAIAKMPGRKDLLAQIVMAILSPGGRIVGAVKALEEKLEKAAG